MFVIKIFHYRLLVLLFAIVGTYGCVSNPANKPTSAVPNTESPGAAVRISSKLIGSIPADIATQSDYNNGLILESGTLSILSQNIVLYASEATSLQIDAFPLLKESRNEFEQILTDLKQKSLQPLAPQQAQFDAVAARWMKFRTAVDEILKVEPDIRRMADLLETATSLMPTMLEKSDEIIQSMIDINAEAQQVFIASRQLMVLIRLSFNLDRFFRGGQGATAAASRIESDAKLFGEVTEGMLNGNSARDVHKFSDPEGIQLVQELAESYQEFSGAIAQISKRMPVLFKAQEIAATLYPDSETFLLETIDLTASYSTKSEALTSDQVSHGHIRCECQNSAPRMHE